MAYKGSAADKASRKEYRRRWRRTPAGRAARATQARRRKQRQNAEGRAFTDREAARARAYYLAHKKTLLAEAKIKREAQREASKVTEVKSKKRRDLAARYKLTPGQYEVMLQARGSHCPICQEPSKPVVDHCHETGFVRGLICNGCNAALGMAKDNPATLRALATYLEETLTARLFS